MRAAFVGLASLLALIPTLAQAEEPTEPPSRVWVFFSDQGRSPEQLERELEAQRIQEKALYVERIQAQKDERMRMYEQEKAAELADVGAWARGALIAGARAVLRRLRGRRLQGRERGVRERNAILRHGGRCSVTAGVASAEKSCLRRRQLPISVATAIVMSCHAIMPACNCAMGVWVAATDAPLRRLGGARSCQCFDRC